MRIPSKPGLFRRLPILALSPVLSLAIASAAPAQLPPGAVVQPLPQSNDPAELLAQALRTLATEPANLAALTAAGHNALILGDPNAAVGFFGRAQEIAPANGAVRAGLGSALVQLEKPRDALRLFGEASRLGVADSDIAEDRGLAYDLTGQQALAQRDYRTVLAAHPEDETARRRLALSQGISGDKAGAIATLDPLIRKRDIAGWRAQTFVLAMDGDPQGANAITRIMLPQQSAMLQPFLVRLAGLSPADKARAVHFGEMPSSGAAYTPVQVASVDTPATYASAPPPRPYVTPAPVTRAPSPAPVVSALPQPALATAKTVQVASATPQPRILRRPPGVEVNDRDAIFALGQPQYVRAPLAGIALTPAQPARTQPVTQPAPAPSIPAEAPPASVAAVSSGSTFSTPIAATVVASTSIATAPPPLAPQAAKSQPASAPAMQLAQSSLPPSDLAGPPAPPSALPTPAAEGHYDLPHDAVTNARPIRPAPSLAPAGTIGTPVQHGTVAAVTEARADNDAATETRVKGAKAPAPARPAPTRTVPSVTDDADATPAKSARKAATADSVSTKSGAKRAATDDCVPVVASKRTRRGKAERAATGCTTLVGAAADPSVSSEGRRVFASDDDGCAPVARSKGRAKTRVSARCAKLASNDEADDSGKTNTAKGKRTAAEDAGTKSARSPKSKPADKPAAERVYVQVAGGANKDDMDKAWAGVKQKAPELMKGHKPLTTPLRATNRLLVGPFKDDDEAQAFVNKMAAKGLSAFTFKSEKGQKVETIDSDR